MGDLAPHGSYPGKEALQRATAARLAAPVPTTPAEPEFKMYTPEQTKRIGKLNVLNPLRKPLISIFPFLTKVVYKNLTVKQYAELLMKTAEVPLENQEPFLPYILPYLDPAKKPDYSLLLVEAGQPCKKTRIKKDFELLQSALTVFKENLEETKEDARKAIEEADTKINEAPMKDRDALIKEKNKQIKKMNERISDEEESIKTVLEGRYIANAPMLVEPLGQSGIAQNLDYDVHGNAIGVETFQVNRFYECDRFLELRYPEAHTRARLRWIDMQVAQYSKTIKTAAQLTPVLEQKKKELDEAIDEAIQQSGSKENGIPTLITQLVDVSALLKIARNLGVLAFDVEASVKYAEQILPILQKADDEHVRAVVPPRPPETSAAKLAIEKRANQTVKAGRRRSKTNRKTRKNKKEHRNVVPSHRKRRGTARR